MMIMVYVYWWPIQICDLFSLYEISGIFIADFPVVHGNANKQDSQCHAHLKILHRPSNPCLLLQYGYVYL